MSNLKRNENMIKLAELKGSFRELEATKMLIGGTTYYAKRRLVLKEAIENLVREILGLSVPRAAKHYVIVETSEEQPEVEISSVRKALVTEHREDSLSMLASLFGIDVPDSVKNVDQYMVTEIEGLLKL